MLLAMCYAQKDDLPAWVDAFNHLHVGGGLVYLGNPGGRMD